MALGKDILGAFAEWWKLSLLTENISQTLKFLKSLPNKPQSVDLLPYHNTAAHKYRAFWP